MLDRLTSMRVFIQTAIFGSLSAAGRSMGISPTMATKHLDSLETRLGVKLLHRTTRQLKLTDAGREFLPTCLRILQELDEAEADLSAKSSSAVGKLRISVPLSFGVRFISPLLTEFSHRYPQVELEVGFSDARNDLLQQNWDLILRIGHLNDSSLKARRLSPVPMRICASPEYLLKHGTPRKITDLSSHNCLSYTLSELQNRGFWYFGRDADIHVPVEGNLRADNGDALLAAAIAGQGIIYQPDFIVANALAQGSLLEITLDQAVADLGGLYVLFTAGKRLPTKIRVMIDYLVEKLA